MWAPGSSTRRGRRALTSILVDICAGRGVINQPGSTLVGDLVHAVRYHRIAPLAHVALRESAPELSAVLQPDRVRATLVHLQACGALHQLDTLLPDIGWVTFKGPVFSELAHPLPGLRTYNDVDVLIAPSDLPEVSHRLWSAGWRLADYQDMLRNPQVPGEMHWISPGGALMDLHWSMINMASRRRLFTITTADLLRRRVPISLGSHSAWTLDPTDSLIHACLHAALTGGNKLIYLIDVDRLSTKINDWSAVTARAKEWQAEAPVSLVLARARRVLRTDYPAGLEKRLGIPRTLRGLMALSDWVAPVPEARGNAGFSRFVARAIQPTIPATACMVGRNATRGIKEALLKRPAPREHREPADQKSLEVYLAAVESAAARVGIAGESRQGHD